MAFINLRRKKGIYFGGEWERERGRGWPPRVFLSLVALPGRAKPSAAESRGSPR